MADNKNGHPSEGDKKAKSNNHEPKTNMGNALIIKK